MSGAVTEASTGRGRDVPTDQQGPPRRAHTGPKRNTARHQDILAATVETLSQTGYKGLTIEEVASRAGVGKQTIYRWWPTKAPLVLEALLHCLKVNVAPTTGNLRLDLVQAVRGTIANYTQEVAGATISALAAELSHDPELIEQFRTQFLRPRRAAAGASLRHAMTEGAFPEDADVELIMDIFAGTIFYRTLISGEPVDDTLADRLVDLILRGTVPGRTTAKAQEPDDEGDDAMH